MNFDLSDAQRSFQRGVRTVCEERLAPLAGEVDRTGSVPPGNLQALAEVGYLGTLIPEAFGGNAGDLVSAILGTEEIARICPSTALVAGTTLLRFAAPLVLYGTRSQQERFLPGVAAGGLRGAWALTEPQGGSDTVNLETRATRVSGGYTIQGEKAYVINGRDCGALLVVARLEGPEGPPPGTGAFLVGSPVEGVEKGEELRPMGARGISLCGIRFRQCRLGQDARLGGDGGPNREALERMPHGALLVAGYAVGVGQACLEEAISYARRRTTFGRPIVSYQEVHFKIADMQVNIDVARQLSLRAAWLVDQAMGSPVEASVAKLFASEMAPLCASLCAQIHGGKGVLEGTRVDRLLRDSRIAQVAEGTPEMHRLFIAGEVLGGRA
jgi:butyryl-CoA dehydrogenase